MTTNELIKLVLDRDAKATTAVYRTAAPLLARKLQRAMEALEKLDLDAMVTLSHEVQEIAATAIAEIEAME